MTTKRITTFMILICLCALGSIAWASNTQITHLCQVQSYRELENGGLLSYTNLGITFDINHDMSGISSVSVMPAKHPRQVSGKTASIIPGTSAYDVKLGESAAAASKLKGLENLSHTPDNLAISRKISPRVKMLITLKASKVNHIIVEGSFRTPEGISEKSSIDQIVKAYGEPDTVYARLPNTNTPGSPVRDMAGFLVMPIAGLAAGLLSKRAKSRFASPSGQSLFAALTGAILCTTGVIASISITSGGLSFISTPLTYPLTLVSATCGATAGLLLTAISARNISRFHRFASTLLTVILVFLIGWLTFRLFFRYTSGPAAYSGFGMFMVLFTAANALWKR